MTSNEEIVENGHQEKAYELYKAELDVVADQCYMAEVQALKEADPRDDTIYTPFKSLPDRIQALYRQMAQSILMLRQSNAPDEKGEVVELELAPSELEFRTTNNERFLSIMVSPDRRISIDTGSFTLEESAGRFTRLVKQQSQQYFKIPFAAALHLMDDERFVCLQQQAEDTTFFMTHNNRLYRIDDSVNGSPALDGVVALTWEMMQEQWRACKPPKSRDYYVALINEFDKNT